MDGDYVTVPMVHPIYAIDSCRETIPQVFLSKPDYQILQVYLVLKLMCGVSQGVLLVQVLFILLDLIGDIWLVVLTRVIMIYILMLHGVLQFMAVVKLYSLPLIPYII